MAKIILTGDVNLMNVADPATPFRRVRDEFRSADLVFSNLECCLYAPPVAQSFHTEGFFADPAVGAEALRGAGIAAVGIANNVNYGRRRSYRRSHALMRPGSRTPAPEPTWRLRRRRSWWSGPAYGSGFCSEVPSIGRPTMKPDRMIRASRCCGGIPLTRCRCTRYGRKSRR